MQIANGGPIEKSIEDDYWVVQNNEPSDKPEHSSEEDRVSSAAYLKHGSTTLTVQKRLLHIVAIAVVLFLTAPVSTLHAQSSIEFDDATDSALPGFSTETWGASFGDYNGDHWPDVFVGNHRERPTLYRNNGDGTFTDVMLPGRS